MQTYDKQPCIDCGKLTKIDEDYKLFLCKNCQREVEFKIDETLNPISISVLCCCCQINSVCPADGQDTCNDCLRRM